MTQNRLRLAAAAGLGEPLPATVFACGPYEVVKTDAGWLGWFSATEKGQTPADA